MSELPQHLAALARANEIRLARADLKKELKAGTLSAVDALSDERAQGMPIFELLQAQTRWGVNRTRRLCQRLMINEIRRVRDLTERQRRDLVLALEGTYVPWWADEAAPVSA